MIVHHILTSTLDTLGAVPNPGDGSKPPGFDKFTDIMGWVKWLSLGVLVISLMVAGAKLAFARDHDGGQQAMGIGRVLIGCLVVSGAFTIVGALV